MKRKIMAICLVVALMVGTVGCGAKSDCKELINNLETACNTMDVSGILDCFNPDTVAPLKVLVNAIGSGKDSVVNFIYDALGITVTEEESEEVTQKFELEVEEIEITDETGTVKCKLNFEAGDSLVEKEIVFKVIKVDEQWYIDGLK